MPHVSPQSCWGLQSCSLSVPVPEMLQLSCSERQAQPQCWWLQLQRRTLGARCPSLVQPVAGRFELPAERSRD